MIGRLTHDIIAPHPAEITKFKEINQLSRRSFASLDRAANVQFKAVSELVR
jgi:hypothetical protein